MKALNKRLAAAEAAQPQNKPRLVCIKTTMGVDADTSALLHAAGVQANLHDTLVLIRKPEGTGGPDRVLSVNGNVIDEHS